MPRTPVLFHLDERSACPLIDWLGALQPEARARCIDRIERLEELGHELRRPHAGYLGGGIYELRVKFYRLNYRMLYFFHGQTAIVISHGIATEQEVPAKEIKLAVERKARFEADPQGHTFRPPEQEPR